MTRIAATPLKLRLRPLLALALLAAAVLVAACNTTEGFRKDLEILGRDIDQKVDEIR